MNELQKIPKNTNSDNTEDILVSDCCGAEPIGNGDIDSADIGICPECKEHCEYVKI